MLAAIKTIVRADSIRNALLVGEVSRRTLFIACVTIIVASCLLRMSSPIFVIGMAVQDDFLFVRLARHIVDGQWLGPFDNLTLVKGMGYPAFIALAFALGIPLKLAEHLLYLGGAGVMAWVVKRLTGDKLLALVLFGVLAFSPVLWSVHLARIIRESFYIGLTLMVIALAAIVLLVPARDGRRAARNVLLVMLGLLGGWFWVTREEGIWLLPPLAVLVTGAAAQAIWFRSSGEAGWATRTMVARTAGAALLVAVPFAAVLLTVASMNYHRYGIFTTDEMRASGYRAGYNAFARIRHEPWRRWLVAPKEVREKAYAVSEAARELRPYFEGAGGEEWRRIGCVQSPIDPCPEIVSAWFMWALRDAVQHAGHYTDGRAAMAYYHRLAAEVDAACRDGRLSCLPAQPSPIVPFRWHYVWDAVTRVPSALRLIMFTGTPSRAVRSTYEPRARVDFIADMAGTVLRPRSRIVLVRGTASDESMRPQVLMQDRDGLAYNSQIDIFDPAGPRSTTFELATDCLRPTCELVIRTDRETWSAALASLQRGSHAVGKLQVTIESVAAGRGSLGGAVVSPALRLIHRVVVVIDYAVYAALTPLMALLAVAGLIMAFVWRKFHRLPFGLWVIAFTCAAAVASRVAMLAYLDAAILYAINGLYLSPAIPFFQIFIVLGVYMGAIAWLGRKERRGSTAVIE